MLTLFKKDNRSQLHKLGNRRKAVYIRDIERIRTVEKELKEKGIL